jgi:hypothetical protein
VSETAQATGARSRIIYCKEATWGTAPTSGYRELLLVGGESLNSNVAIYRSAIIRSDRMKHRSVRGTHRPGGSIPFELTARGLAFMFWHALGGTPTTTGPTSGLYTHVLAGSNALPTGFTLEKGFLDLTTPMYEVYKGCRVNTFNLNFGVDAMVGGAFSIEAREAALSSTSVTSSSVVSQPDVSPITSVEAVLSKDGVQLATCTNLGLNFTNNLYVDNGFVLGSNYRVNLKPGDRDVDGSATFLFENSDFYDLAINGDIVDLQIVCTDSNSHSVTIDLDEVQLLPNDTSPKIENDGPLYVNANFESLKDSVTGTNITVTFVNDETVVNV